MMDIQIDNRGTEEIPFGYVYLDNTRVGYSQGDGVWTTWDWPATQEHQDAAKAALDEAMPGWSTVQEGQS